jgi:pimeloyl-ACP methyl ester carboxylesterase
MAFFTTNDGCKLHYEDVGSGKVLLLIHGWSQSSGLFKKNIPELSKAFRVVSLDLRARYSGRPRKSPERNPPPRPPRPALWHGGSGAAEGR